jgi:hypothetical protein
LPNSLESIACFAAPWGGFYALPRSSAVQKTPFIAALKLTKFLDIQTIPVLEVESIDEAKRHRGAVRC